MLPPLYFFEDSHQPLTFGEFLALLIDRFVFVPEHLFELLEILHRMPAIDGEVPARAVGVTQQPGSVVGRAAAEENRPETLAVVQDFKFLLTSLQDAKLPNDTHHGVILR